MGKPTVKQSRRRFVKSSAIMLTAFAASSISGPLNAIVFATKKPAKGGVWWGIGFDIKKCIGCGMCVKACKQENNVPAEPFYFRTWVEQYTIMNDGSLRLISPNGGINGFQINEPGEEIFKTFFVPKMCNHCEKSPCTQVCPVGATYTSPEGVSLIDQDYCIGCAYCVQACPYGCRYIHPEKKVADKCTLCYHRLKKDLPPACMEICPTGARIYGDLNDMSGKLVAFIKENDCQVLKPHLNTGSKLFYNALNSEVR